MALRTCTECGNEVSTKAESCPSCGAVLKRKTGCVGFLVAGLLVLVVLGVIGALMNEQGTRSSSKPEAGFAMPSLGRQIVTFDEYQRIQHGMSYSQVVGIIGAEGEEMSRNKIDGIPGVMESIETVMYQWINSNGSNMNAMFQNDRLNQKAQFGLQ